MLTKSYIELEELVEKIVDNRGKSVPTSDAGIPLIATNCIKHSSIYPTFENIRFVTEEIHENWFRANLEPGDILFVNKGTPGRVCMVPNPVNFCAAQDMVGLRFKKHLDQRYMLAVLRSEEIQKAIQNNHVGVVIPHFRKKELLKLKLPIVQPNYQLTIGNFYFALSQKIELNNRINSELEAMAKLIYEYWFVQFDFPDANGKPYKASGGKMVWNEQLKREIPEGWDDGNLLDIGELAGGGTPSTKNLEFWGGDIPFFTPTDSENTVFKITTAQHITIEGLEKSSTKLFEKGTIFITARGTVGNINVAGKNMAMNQSCYAVKASEGSYPFLYFSVKSVVNYLKAKSSGSIFKSIVSNDIKFTHIAVAPLTHQKEFNSATLPIFESILNNQKQNQELAALRDWLLPMLMNGQVRVGVDSVVANRQTTQYPEFNEEINIAAEEQVKFVTESQPVLNFRNQAFSKQVLAGKVVSVFKDEPDFTHIKFQKIQFLAEHIAEADLNLNYYYQAAGPYDNRFMHSIADKFRASKWFDEKNYSYEPMEKLEQIDRYFEGDFKPKLEILDRLFTLLKGKTEAETEILATTYAVWNNRIILKQDVGAKYLIEDFFAWSNRKYQFSADQVLEAITWLVSNGFQPTGFGKELKRAKN